MPLKVRGTGWDRTFAARGANSYPISGFEEPCLRDGVVNLGLKNVKEAFLAYLLPCFWPLQDCSGIVAKSASSGRHDQR